MSLYLSDHTCAVMLRGRDHVAPTSSLRRSHASSLPVSRDCRLSTPPCGQLRATITKTAPVVRSTNGAARCGEPRRCEGGVGRGQTGVPELAAPGCGGAVGGRTFQRPKQLGRVHQHPQGGPGAAEVIRGAHHHVVLPVKVPASEPPPLGYCDQPPPRGKHARDAERLVSRLPRSEHDAVRRVFAPYRHRRNRCPHKTKIQLVLNPQL